MSEPPTPPHTSATDPLPAGSTIHMLFDSHELDLSEAGSRSLADLVTESAGLNEEQRKGVIAALAYFREQSIRVFVKPDAVIR